MSLPVHSRPRGPALVAAVVAMLIAPGCASNAQVLRAEVDSLRDRLAELETERGRQARQVEDLTTRLVAVEGRLTRPQRRARSLPVVKVQPGERHERRREPEPRRAEAEAEAEAEGWEEDSVAARHEDDGRPRPVLRLHGASVEPAPVGQRRPRRAIALASVSERLPVVPMPDAPSPSSAPAEPVAPAAPVAPPPESVEQVVREARGQLGAGQCAQALQALAQVLQSSPEHALADDAMLLRAQCHRRQGAHLRAIGELERMGRRYPRSNRQSDALLLMAESYAAIGDLERARQLFGQVMRRFPRSRAASRATARVQELSRGSRAVEEP